MRFSATYLPLVTLATLAMAAPTVEDHRQYRDSSPTNLGQITIPFAVPFFTQGPVSLQIPNPFRHSPEEFDYSAHSQKAFDSAQSAYDQAAKAYREAADRLEGLYSELSDQVNHLGSSFGDPGDICPDMKVSCVKDGKTVGDIGKKSFCRSGVVCSQCQ
ncbi:hypothetical protein IE53DRAFT_70924 [Violaceomyces palustris]|uniref:Uncharacterized protein n=1 Tax=Violaceomyces palustris TaxID=1673888 RepID=A0ACD0P8S6_9BASI|nr:hypothetical protein IE53DRAFT_70924 [Violaceomyces palustris]